MKTLFRLFSLIIIFSLLSAIPTLSMVASAEDGILHETDDNNSKESANVLEVGAITVGRLSDESDVDYYRIETTSTGDILFHFDHQSDKVYNYYWYAEVTDEQNAVLNSGNLSGKEPTDFSVQSVKPGVYYLKIAKAVAGNPFMIGFSDASYTITASTKCLVHAELADWEISLEPSCNSDGERVQRCSACGEIIVTEKIKELDHSFTDWTIEDEAELLKLGKKKCTCVLCGKIKNKTYMSDESKAALKYGAIGIGAIIVILFIIACFAPSDIGANTPPRNYKSSDLYDPTPPKNDTSKKEEFDYYYPITPYDDVTNFPKDTEINSWGDDYYPTHHGPTVTKDGIDYPVHTHDAEGYSTDPYIEDAEGYKTPVDPGDIDPPFDWLDC